MRDTHTQYDWDSDDQYNREKYAHTSMYRAKKDEELREELTGITYLIRKDLQCRRINVFVNQELQIVLSAPLNEVENILTLTEVYDELRRLEKEYLSDFDISNHEISLGEDDKPTIYCSYERI